MKTINVIVQLVRFVFIGKGRKIYLLKQRKCGEVTKNSIVSIHMPGSSY